jgi:YfiH family protein
MTLPIVPESFYWTQSPCGPALKCRPLEAVAAHLFTTREPQLSSADDWHRVGNLLGVAEVITSNQVHGREVATLRRGLPRAPARQDADVLVSDDPEVAIAVRAADCVPLLLADSTTGAVAAVHAGWRGTAAGAVTAAVDALWRQFGSRPEDVVAAIGPSIGACCYEVGTEVVDAFAAAGHPRHLIHRWFLAPPARRSSFRPALSGVEGPRLRLDVVAANRDQLMLAGLREGNIYACGLCTAMHLDVLTSYRAEKEKAGRLGAVIRARAG